MSERNKEILLEGNAAITAGNYEGFLSHCSEDTVWNFIGEETLNGKQAVREWMSTTYIEPPKVIVDNLIAEGNWLTAIGKVSMKEKDGSTGHYFYCDVWRFAGEQIVELRAFVIKIES